MLNLAISRFYSDSVLDIATILMEGTLETGAIKGFMLLAVGCSLKLFIMG